MRRIALAYSGGLDTTVALRYLKETQKADLIAVAVDVGQHEDLDAIVKRALNSGAVDAVAVQAADEFASDFVVPALRANALYQGKYPLVSALSRPLIAKHLVETARKFDAHAVAHGCTGKGNDQVRFEVSLGALAPDLEVIAPVRDWGLSRDDAIDYAALHDLDVDASKKSPYSIDENLWGRTIECGELEDPFAEPPDDIWERTVVTANRAPVSVEISFDAGLPVALDGKELPFDDIVRRLDQLAGSHGFGRVDMIEDRVVGMKSREVYEVPGALALISAHIDLEELTLDGKLLRTKRHLEQTWTESVYDGFWYSPLRESLDAFFDKTASAVTGDVRLQVSIGSVAVTGRRSQGSLYDRGLATYSGGDAFDHSSAAGFVKLTGLALKTWAASRRRP